LIKPELPNSGVALDVGSAEGYFTKAIADQTEMLAVSIEQHPAMIERQFNWINSGTDYKGKIILCNTKFDGELAGKISLGCDWFDVTLFLSVLHWMQYPDFVLRKISQMSGKVFVELPVLEDKHSPGQKYLKRIRKDFGSIENYLKVVSGRHVRHLGAVKAYTTDHRNLYVLEGDLFREPARSSVAHIANRRKVFEQKFVAGRLHFLKNFRKVSWTPAINAATCRELNVIFPENPWWKSQVLETLSKAYGLKTEEEVKAAQMDIRLFNLLAVRGGVQFIDIGNDNNSRTTIFKDIVPLGMPYVPADEPKDKSA
jgi:SAM-dependent methyltransferase